MTRNGTITSLRILIRAQNIVQWRVVVVSNVRKTKSYAAESDQANKGEPDIKPKRACIESQNRNKRVIDHPCCGQREQRRVGWKIWQTREEEEERGENKASPGR